LILGNPEGWDSALILFCLIGAAALLVAFVVIELRSRYPMLDLSLFRKPAFNGVSAVAFGLSAGMFAMFLYLTIYMQGVLDYSPLEAGLRFLPLTVLGFIVAPISGALSHRVPIRVLLGVGLATVGVGLLLMHGVSPDSGWTTLLGGFLVAGIGIGITNPGIGQAAIAVVPVEKSGMGSGINTTFRQVGIATGVAGLGAVFQSSVNSKISELLPRAPSGLGEIVASGGSRAAGAVAPAGIKPEVVHASDVAFVSAFNEIIMIAAVLSFVGAALGFALVRSRDFVQQAGPEDETAAEPVAA
jgi:predicted MFS family arabinose efflux permease